MSDLAQTVSCERLPHSIAARMERSRFNCPTSSLSGVLNFSSTRPAVPAFCGAFAIRLLQAIIPSGHARGASLGVRVALVEGAPDVGQAFGLRGACGPPHTGKSANFNRAVTQEYV